MPTTLTLKNIPDTVYQMLKASAESSRRSLNNEAIVCLQAVLMRTRADLDARPARARALRATLSPMKFKPRDIRVFKAQGRP